MLLSNYYGNLGANADASKEKIRKLDEKDLRRGAAQLGINTIRGLVDQGVQLPGLTNNPRLDQSGAAANFAELDPRILAAVASELSQKPQFQKKLQNLLKERPKLLPKLRAFLGSASGKKLEEELKRQYKSRLATPRPF